MKKEWFEKLSEVDKAKEAVIGIQELRPYIYNTIRPAKEFKKIEI